MWIGPWNKLEIEKHNGLNNDMSNARLQLLMKLPASNLGNVANPLNGSDQLRAKAVVTRLEIVNSILASMFEVICCLKS